MTYKRSLKDSLQDINWEGMIKILETNAKSNFDNISNNFYGYFENYL